jgi:hypothetical protein
VGDYPIRQLVLCERKFRWLEWWNLCQTLLLFIYARRQAENVLKNSSFPDISRIYSHDTDYSRRLLAQRIVSSHARTSNSWCLKGFVGWGGGELPDVITRHCYKCFRQCTTANRPGRLRGLAILVLTRRHRHVALTRRLRIYLLQNNGNIIVSYWSVLISRLKIYGICGIGYAHLQIKCLGLFKQMFIEYIFWR